MFSTIIKHENFYNLSIKVYFLLFTFTSFYTFYDLYNGLIYSVYASLLATFGYFLSMYFLLLKKRFILATYTVYIFLGVAVIWASYLEGLMSGCYWFLFDMLFAIPFMIRREDYFLKHTKILYLLTFIMIGITVIISPRYSTVYDITPLETHAKLMLNSTACFIIIMLFSILALRFGQRFVKKIYKEKQRAEKEKDSRTRVLANLGHELRTQINSINGVTQLILEKNSQDSTDKKYIDILEYCNNKMLVLVNDMLDMHKIESGGFELFYQPKPIEPLLSKMTLPFLNTIEEKKLKLINDIDQKLSGVIVNIDENRLTQVIHNLLSNAIKFTDKGSIIFKVVQTNRTSEKIEILFSVSDTGVGILKEDYLTIFESFQQVKNSDNASVFGGTGLGLAISKTIIEKMGGEIQVESVIKKGTTFSFKLVLDNVKKIPAIIENDNKDISLSDKNILVVEDNKISMMFVDKLLKKYKINTLKAFNGLEAIEHVKSSDTLDLVLLDLEMPLMNGFDAISHIKSIKPDLIVIAFTANIPTQEVIYDLNKLGFNDIISKPFNEKNIVKILSQHLS